MGRRTKSILCLAVYCFIAAFVIPCAAQEKGRCVVEGTVLCAETDTPIAGAFVSFIKDNKIVASCLCDGDGAFSMSFINGAPDAVSASMLGYAPAKTQARQGGRMTIRLKEKKLSIKASTVTSSVIEHKGDTTSYSAGAFRDQKDRELILNHPSIREYTTIWMDSLRDGAFQLANTNKLIRFYDGATGLKTGSTDAARFCISATAERDGMELIAVILKSPTKDTRTATAKSMLDFGFANYTVLDAKPAQALPPVKVLLGQQEYVQPVLSQTGRILVEKAQVNAMETSLSLCADVEAPVAAGQKLGEMTVTIDGQVKEVIDIVSAQEVPRLTTFGIFRELLDKFFLAK